MDDTDVLYEECPDCQGEANLCLTCWDSGIVVHDCTPTEE